MVLCFVVGGVAGISARPYEDEAKCISYFCGNIMTCGSGHGNCGNSCIIDLDDKAVDHGRCDPRLGQEVSCYVAPELTYLCSGKCPDDSFCETDFMQGCTGP